MKSNGYFLAANEREGTRITDSSHSRSFASIRGLLCLLVLASPVHGAVEGVVLNGTTGREQGGVEVTLLKLEQGMIPVGTARSDNYGKFRFIQSVSAQATPFLLRGEFEGVTYNQMIPPGARTGDIKLTVYRSVKAQGNAGAPEQHFFLFEPGGKEMIVNEFFLFRNQSNPPVTYADPQQGTLRFYLPAAAKGVVQASATGPGGMPIRVTAEESERPDIHTINFPIKPGDSRIELTYLVPYQSPMEFEVRSLYDGLATRIAAPSGVALSGDGLQPLPENPQIKASLFNLPDTKSFRFSIAGEGRLSRERESTGEGGGNNISIIPAAIHSQLALVLGFTFAILALGFYTLYAATPAAPAEKPARGRGKRKS